MTTTSFWQFAGCVCWAADRRMNPLSRCQAKTGAYTPELASSPGAIYPKNAGQGRQSLARRLHFLEPLTPDADLLMMFVDRFAIRGIQHAIYFVVPLVEPGLVMCDRELVRRRVL